MDKEYTKNFDAWNEKKQSLEKRILPVDFFFLEGEIWWTALGVNLGHEIDGKNALFERPVLIIKKVSEELLWALPITSTRMSGEDFYAMKYKSENRTILLSQIRIVSDKRLLRMIYRIDSAQFEIIKEKVCHLVLAIKAIPSD